MKIWNDLIQNIVLFVIHLDNFFTLTFSFLSGGIYNYAPTPQRSERGRKRGRERVCFERLESHKFIVIFWCDFDLVSQNVCFEGIWEMKFENLFILDSITHGSTEGTYLCTVTFGWRSWCDCQKCEMRKRDEK